MSRKIITTPNPKLRQKSEKVREIDDEVLDIIEDMKKFSREWEQAHPYELSAAMAAPQIGENRRIIIVRDDLDDKENEGFTALINPEVIRAEGRKLKEQEGCLSVPELYGMIERPSKVKIKAILEDGTEVRLKASGYLARTLLHEIEHLDGILFIDHIKNQKDAFYRINQDGDLVPVDYDKEIRGNKQLFPED